MTPFISLRFLFPLLLMFAALVSGLGSFLYMLPEGEQKVEKKSIENVKQVMNILQSSITVMLRRNDMAGIHIQLASLYTDYHTTLALVTDEQGKILVRGEQSEQQGMLVGKVAPFMDKKKFSDLKNLHGGEVFLSANRQYVRAVYPIHLPEQNEKLYSTRIGFLVYERFIGRDKIVERKQHENHFAMMMVLMLGVITVLWLIFHYLVTRRVTRLLEVTRQLAAGNLSVQTGMQGRDEFSRIGQALDVMAGQLYADQQELALSEQRLRTSQIFANMGNWDLDIVTGDLFWSDTIAPMFGLDIRNDQVTYDLFINSVHPDDRRLVEQGIENCVDKNEDYNVEHRIVKPDGSIRWIHEIGNVERDASGKAVHMLGIVRDITRQKEFDAQLQKTLRDLHYQKDAIDQHSIVAVTDLAGVITYANAKFSEVSGYSHDELLGKTHRIVNSGFHPQEFFTEFWRSISVGKIWQGEICNRKKNGDIYWVDTTVVPHLDETGKPDRFVAIRTDITERKSIDEQLHLQASALKAAADGMVITNREGIVQWVNPAFTQLTGYSFDEAIGQNLKILNSGKHHRSFYKKLWDTILAGKTWQGELWNKRKNGKLYLEEQTITPVRDQAGKIEHFISIKRDISERHQLQLQLQQAQKMEAIGQLTGGIAHDFNNMLASIMGYTQLANEGIEQYDNATVLKGYLNEVYKSSLRARDLVAQMLAFSRGGEGELKPLMLSPLINESLKMLGSTLPSSIEMDLRLGDDEYTVMTNPVQLHQMIMNLSINARDAMQGKGHFSISLDRVNDVVTICRSCHKKMSGNYIVLSFRDTGSGIKPEHLDRIFDPFYTTKEVGKGTGMGLSMVHGIMHNHGGHITVDTEAGKGTTFTLWFPVIDAQVDTVNVVNSEIKTIADNKLSGNILIVDDEASVGIFIGELLKINGCRVTVETDSQLALLRFKESPASFDLVVTDQTMPGMTGVELAQALLEIRPDLPVLLCTGYSEHVNEDSARSMGIQGYLTKPIKTKEFLQLVGSLLPVKVESKAAH